MNALDTQTELFDLFGETGTCAVCQDDLKDGDRVRTIRACQHLFHATCLDPWLLQKGDCPMCRTKLTLTPAHAAQIQMNGVRSAQENIRMIVDALRQGGEFNTVELGTLEGALNQLETLIVQAAPGNPAAINTVPSMQERTLLTYCLVEGLFRRYPFAQNYNPQRQAVLSFLEHFQLDGLRPILTEFNTHTALKKAKRALALAIAQARYPTMTAEAQRTAARNVWSSNSVRHMRERLRAAQQVAAPDAPLRRHILV